MKIKLLILITLTFLLNISILAQAQNLTAKDYKDLVSKIKSGDTKTDYKKLRLSFVETENYSSYGYREGREGLFKALNDKKFDEAIKNADSILDKCYVELNAHYVSAIANRELGKNDKFEFHRDIYIGLINSILDGGDGKSTKTAWTVITIDEEYAILNYLGFQRTTQSLLAEDGHRFDVLQAFNIKNKEETAKFYFNIDIVWKGYEK